VLGFGGDSPIVASLKEGLAAAVRRPTALLIGVAPRGGRLPQEWVDVVARAADLGLDLVSGLHDFLADVPAIRGAAERAGVAIVDLRRPPTDLPVSTGRAREVEAFTVLTVGTDCNIGKMTAGLRIREAVAARGARVGFAATGQTGILIEGWGIAVDAVIADFVGGAAERLVLQAAEGNDVVLVEGQGSLVHPGYSGVTLGLLHGSMPDAQILCHQPTRKCPYGGGNAYNWMPLPDVPEMIRICEEAMAPLRPSKVIGVALITFDMDDAKAREVIERTAAETGLPVTDPVRYGADVLAEAILSGANAKRAA